MTAFSFIDTSGNENTYIEQNNDNNVIITECKNDQCECIFIVRRGSVSERNTI